MKAWILVGDAVRARIFSTNGSDSTLHSVLEMIHPQSRQKDSEVYADRPGRAPLGAAHGAVTAMPPHQSVHESESVRFAGQVAAALKKGLDEHAFTTLAIVAPPHFLGLLREAMDSSVTRVTAATEVRDLSHVEESQLFERLELVVKRLRSIGPS